MNLGVCGADADVVVARNFGRFIAGGSAGHSDHGRDLIEVLEAIVEGDTKHYKISEPEKLIRIAAEVGVATEGRELNDIAIDLVDELRNNGVEPWGWHYVFGEDPVRGRGCPPHRGPGVGAAIGG